MCLRMLLLFVVCASACPVQAQEAKDEPANYAFAAYMGSGLYSATDASLFVLNISTSAELEKRKDIRLRLSTSAGFFDYGIDHIEQFKVPDSIGTFTVIPGVEKVYPMSPHWELIPHLDWGLSKNFSTKEEAQVYAIGVQSLYYMDADLDHHLWVNKILWAGARTFGTDKRDNFVKLLTGVDYKTRTYFDFSTARTVLTLYSLMSWSYNGIDYMERWRGSTARDLNYEAGLSLFAPKPVDLWITDIDRIGMGLQHSQFGTVVRLFIGTPF